MRYHERCSTVSAFLFSQVIRIPKKTVHISFFMPIVTFVRRVTNDMKGRKTYGKFWLLHFPPVCGAVPDFKRNRYVHQKQKRRLTPSFNIGVIHVSR